MSEDQAEILRRLGLKIKGLSEVGNKMGFIDFTELFTQLQIIDNSDQHKNTISTKDLYGKITESPNS